MTYSFKRMFTSEEEHSGMRALGVKEGGLVVLLMSGRTPFLVRSVGYRGQLLIGKSYVHGIMHLKSDGYDKIFDFAG